MIRINLVAAERRAAKAAGRSFQVGQKATVVGTLILLVTFAGVGWRYWAVTGVEAGLDRDIAAARREEGRLAEILKQVQAFEAQRQQLEQRVALIDELRKGQNAPVHIIDQVSRALPDMMWLTTVRQDGFDVTIEGRCLSLTELSDFVGNLEASRYFQRPVEILNSEVIAGSDGGPELIRFSVKGTFQMAGVEAPPPPQTGRRPAARGGKRG
ncbi:MAG: PilN domain-containing protein [Vicinamibacterales bacterium]